MTSLYIHIPFCASKCFYCSFVISVGQSHRMDRYLDCLEREAKKHSGAHVQTVYIGGGTPTFMSASHLRRLFCIVRENFHLSDRLEWTIEANPEDIDNSKLCMIKDAGVNRISLGVQSLNDDYLKYLGRNHDASSALDAFDRIRKAGFDNINVDMMFSFPGQSDSELAEDINKITQLKSDHLSLYSLQIEKYSKFCAQKVQLQDDQVQAQQYEIVCQSLETKGFEQYEVSNFSKPGRMALHNLNYWQGGFYVGLGIGAHSHMGMQRSWNCARLNEYISRIENNQPAQEGSEDLTLYNKMKEVVLFALRMNSGYDVKQIKSEFGCYLGEEQQKKIDQYIEGGLLIEEKGRIRTSLQGRLVLDEICAQLV